VIFKQLFVLLGSAPRIQSREGLSTKKPEHLRLGAWTQNGNQTQWWMS